ISPGIGVFNSQNKFPAVMPRKQPVEKRRARPANMQIAGRRGGEADADVRTHCSDPVMVGTDRRAVHSVRRARRSRPTNNQIISMLDYSTKILPARRRAWRSCARLTFAI